MFHSCFSGWIVSFYHFRSLLSFTTQRRFTASETLARIQKRTWLAHVQSNVDRLVYGSETYNKVSFNWWAVGLCEGSYAQQRDMTEYSLGGQRGGSASRSPFSSLPMTSLFFTPLKGFTPSIRISHMHTP